MYLCGFDFYRHKLIMDFGNQTRRTTMIYILLTTVILVALVCAIMFFFKAIGYTPQEKLQPGDIVILIDPDSEDTRNMITEVIDVFSLRIVQVRVARTTMTIERRFVRKLPIIPGAPLLVPEEPSIAAHELGNKAGFSPIPLHYFKYEVPCAGEMI